MTLIRHGFRKNRDVEPVVVDQIVNSSRRTLAERTNIQPAYADVYADDSAVNVNSCVHVQSHGWSRDAQKPAPTGDVCTDPSARRGRADVGG